MVAREGLPLMCMSFATAQPACEAAWEPRSATPWRPAPSTHPGGSLGGNFMWGDQTYLLLVGSTAHTAGAPSWSSPPSGNLALSHIEELTPPKFCLEARDLWPEGRAAMRATRGAPPMEGGVSGHSLFWLQICC